MQKRIPMYFAQEQLTKEVHGLNTDQIKAQKLNQL